MAEQVAGLRAGDVVELTYDEWPDGTVVRGPLQGSPESRALTVAAFVVRHGGGGAPGEGFNLTVISRAPRPLYDNHPRQTPVPGDIVRVESGHPDDWYLDLFQPRDGDDGLSWVSLHAADFGYRYSTDEALPLTREYDAVLLVDGETGRAVAS